MRMPEPQYWLRFNIRDRNNCPLQTSTLADRCVLGNDHDMCPSWASQPPAPVFRTSIVCIHRVVGSGHQHIARKWPDERMQRRGACYTVQPLGVSIVDPRLLVTDVRCSEWKVPDPTG